MQSSSPEEAEKDKRDDGSVGVDGLTREEVAALDEAISATWSEVFASCCVHSLGEWLYILFGTLLILAFLYFFLCSLELIGNGAKIMSGCGAANLFGDETNPVAGVCVGLLATVLIQSSSTVTSIVVYLAGDDGTISVKQGIYMVMGANIGTTITNTMVAIGQMADEDELERAFAGATVHDLFNFLTVGVLFPLEVLFGYLYYLTKAMVKNAHPTEGEEWNGPIKIAVAPLVDQIIKSNPEVSKVVAAGGSCSDFYPIECIDGIVSYETCDTALIGCLKDTDTCPLFFAQTATQDDELVAGGVCFALGVICLFTCLLGLVTVLKRVLMGVSSRIIYKATSVNGYASIVIGCLVTVLVQASSITTCVLTPLVGVGVLPLESMYPLTLGANLGTTVTALLAALVSDSVDSLQVALSHLMFNTTGIIIWYPIPFLRRIPLGGARALGRATRLWRGFPFAYVAFAFFLFPLILLGISSLFTQGGKGWTVLGSMVVFLILVFLVNLLYWYCYQDGKAKLVLAMSERDRRNDAIMTLADDMEEIQRKLQILMNYTGAPDYDESTGAPEGGESSTGTPVGGSLDLHDADEEKQPLVESRRMDDNSKDEEKQPLVEVEYTNDMLDHDTDGDDQGSSMRVPSLDEIST